MKTEKVLVTLPIKDPQGNDIVVRLKVSTKDGVVQAMTAEQIKTWDENIVVLSN